MMKKTVSVSRFLLLSLCLALLLTVCVVPASAADIGVDRLPAGFWVPFNAYQAAVDSGDAARIVAAGDALLQWLAGQPVSDQSVNQMLRVYNYRYGHKLFEQLGQPDKASENEDRLWNSAQQLIDMGYSDFVDTIAVLAYGAYEQAEASGDPDKLLTAGDRMLAYYALLPPGDRTEEYIMKIYAARFNARIYEKRGEYDKAEENTRQYLRRAEALTARGMDYADSVIACRAHLDVLTPFTGVYAVSKASALSAGAPAVPVRGTYYGSTAGGYLAGYDGYAGLISGQGSAVSFYIELGKETAADQMNHLRILNDSSRLLLVNLNFVNMGATARALTAGSLDENLESNVKALSGLKHPFLVRIGGEMNVWGPEDGADAPVSPQDFIRAYRYVADRLRAACPNAVLVWSPMQTAKWNESHEDYWPGDGYVDWVGMSLYYNLADVSAQSAAWIEYTRSGSFTDPVAKAEKVMAVAERHQKPVIITESGSNKNGTGGEAEAARLAAKEFSTLNMVWPQVKAMILFDVAIHEAGEDRDFTMTSPGSYRSAVLEAIAANPTLIAAGEVGTCSWTPLGEFSEAAEGTILLGATGRTYADTDLSVTYRLNGQTLAQTKGSPNHCVLDCSGLGGSPSALEVVFEGKDGWRTTRSYAVTRTADGRVTFTEEGGASPFTDVPSDAWYSGAVAFVSGRGLMSGFSADTFGPDSTLTRAQVVQVLYNKEGKPAVNTANPFKDIPADRWYYDAVRWGASRKIVSGYGGSVFKPDDPVTMEQVAVILHNYSGAPAASASLNRVGEHSDWAEPALRWAMEKGLFNGIPSLTTTAAATRAQTAQMLMNFLR